jgi:hypothetical protein
MILFLFFIFKTKDIYLNYPFRRELLMIELIAQSTQ